MTKATHRRCPVRCHDGITKLQKSFFFIACTLMLSGCAHQIYVDSYGSPGFFSGILHGLIAPYAFVGSIFSDIEIYNFPNSGFWYDFGYLLGLSWWVVQLCAGLIKGLIKK